jgi:hypothetical protein
VAEHLTLDIMTQKATCNRFPINPLPYSEDARNWIASQIAKQKIPSEELIGAGLTVEYTFDLSRKAALSIMPIAKFDFACTGSITSRNRQYVSVLKAQKTWGLSTVS